MDNMTTMSVGNKSTSNSSRNSSDVSIFRIGDDKPDDNDLINAKSSESTDLANTQKLKVTVKVKKVKEGVWESYYHCVVAIIITNTIHYWYPTWYRRRDDLKVIHFMLFMIFVQLPMYYLEIFFAQYTREPPINLWKMCPIFIGFCYSVIAYSILQSWLDAIFHGRNLFYVVETVVYNLPWLRCPPELGKTCITFTEKTRLSRNCTVDRSSTMIRCPDRGTFDFSAQHWYKSRFNQKSIDTSLRLDTQWKLVLCSVAHWVFVSLVVTRTVYKFGTAICCLGLAMTIYMMIDVAYTISSVKLVDLIRLVFRPPEIADFFNPDIWAHVYASSIYRSQIVTPPLITTYFAQVDRKFDIAWCTMIVAFVSFTAMVGKAMLHRGMIKIMADQLDVDKKIVKKNDASIAMALVPQHHGILPMPLMWTFVWFFVRYLALLLQSSMVVESILSNLFFKYNVRKEFRVYFISLYSVAGCVVNIVIILRHSISVEINAIYGRILMAGTTLLPLVEASFIILIYGLSVFVTDIHFNSGSPPSFFWICSWKALPLILLIFYLFMLLGNLNSHIPPLSTSLAILKGVLFSIIPIFALKQIMYAVYNDNLSFLVNPVFDWGPSDKEVRKARKRFNPKTDIRSQPERTVDYVKPRDSNRDLTIE